MGKLPITEAECRPRPVRSLEWNRWLGASGTLPTALVLAAVILGRTAPEAATQGSVRDADTALLAAMGRSLPGLTHRLVWHRRPVDAHTDVVIALAWPPTWGCGGACASAPIGPGMTLGIFAQGRRSRGSVSAVTLASDLPECFATVLRVSTSDVVLSCTGEKSETFPHLKFLYDIRTKALVGRYSYAPYVFAAAHLDTSSAPRRARLLARSSSHEAVFDVAVGVRTAFSTSMAPWATRPSDWVGVQDGRNLLDTPFGPDGAFRVIEVSSPADASEGELAVEATALRQRGIYRLPATSYRTFAAARPGEVSTNPGFRYTIDERIGPAQIAGGRLWFGKTFYNGEGFTGVGGLGYFDPADRRFHIFTGPAIADWSVASLLVEPQFVWATLASRGEYGDTSGGVVQFNRRTAAFARRSARGDGPFLRVSEDVMFVVGSTLTVVRGDRSEQYFVDEMPEGRPRVVPLR